MVAAALVGTAVIGGVTASQQASASRSAGRAAADSSVQAAQIQAQQADRALTLQREIYNDQRGIYAPTATLGAGALARQYIMAGGDAAKAREFYGAQTKALNGQEGTDPGLDGYSASSWMTSDPGYAFRLDQGTKALERSAAARGQLFSGATGMALQRYGQDYASGEFMNAFNRLGAIAGTGQTATQNIGGAGQSYSGQATGTLQYSGDAQARGINGAGQARASAYQGVGQAWGNFGNTMSGVIGAAAGYWG